MVDQGGLFPDTGSGHADEPMHVQSLPIPHLGLIRQQYS